MCIYIYVCTHAARTVPSLSARFDIEKPRRNKCLYTLKCAIIYAYFGLTHTNTKCVALPMNALLITDHNVHLLKLNCYILLLRCIVDTRRQAVTPIITQHKHLDPLVTSAQNDT